jgi:hypothetical protein
MITHIFRAATLRALTEGIDRNADRLREQAIEIAEEIWVPSVVISSEWLEQAREGTAKLRCRRLPFEHVRSGRR